MSAKKSLKKLGGLTEGSFGTGALGVFGISIFGISGDLSFGISDPLISVFFTGSICGGQAQNFDIIANCKKLNIINIFFLNIKPQFLYHIAKKKLRTAKIVI